MPATVSVLQIYDADETADLVDEDNIILQNGGYAPAVAPRSLSPLSGRAYENVEEAARVDVTGSTGAVMLANVAKVARLLDKARRWAQTGQGNVVRLKVQAQGSNLSNPLEAVVLGPAPGWSLPATFNDYLQVQEIEDLVIPWLRRGELLGDEETASSSAADHPAVYTADFSGSSHDGVAAAVDVEITGFDPATHNQINSGILFVTSRETSGSAFRIYTRDAEADFASGSARWSAVNDASNNPASVSGEVLRYTPNSTSEEPTGLVTTTAGWWGEALGERVAIAVTVRNNSAQTFYLRAEAANYNLAVTSATDTHVIDPTTYSDPQPLLLGFVSARNGVRYIRFVASVDSTSGSPTMDIDQAVALTMDGESHILKHNAVPFEGIFTVTEPVRIVVAHGLYDNLTPFVGARSERGTPDYETPTTYEGDSLITLRGDLVDAYWMSCNGSDWIDTDQVGATTIQLALTARRRPIFTVPQ